MVEQIGRFEPDWDTREGAMLSAGRLTVTVTSKATQRHVTLKFRSTRRDGDEWPTVPFAEASHVYVEEYDGALVGVYRPYAGSMTWAPGATKEARWTVTHLLRYLHGGFPALRAVAYIDAAAFCGRCGDELTHPESIERGFGPVCWGEATRGRAVTAVAA